MISTTDRTVKETEERIISSKISALAVSELKIRSLLKKISTFEAAAAVLHAS